jgi:hypothetical protein
LCPLLQQVPFLTSSSIILSNLPVVVGSKSLVCWNSGTSQTCYEAGGLLRTYSTVGWVNINTQLVFSTPASLLGCGTADPNLNEVVQDGSAHMPPDMIKGVRKTWHMNHMTEYNRENHIEFQ